jgi:hypothetical protein
MYQAMIDGDTEALASLLDPSYTLTHMTGYLQPKAEWLEQISSGRMRYHSAQEQDRVVVVAVSGDTARLVSRDVVEATIWGSRGTWNLQLTTDYVRRGGTWCAIRTEATTF